MIAEDGGAKERKAPPKRSLSSDWIPAERRDDIASRA